MLDRRGFLGLSLAAVGGVFVPRYGKWYRQGSGVLLVPDREWEGCSISYKKMFIRDKETGLYCQGYEVETRHIRSGLVTVRHVAENHQRPHYRDGLFMDWSDGLKVGLVRHA